MPPGFGRLPFLGRRSTRAESSPSDGAAVRPPIDLELAPVGPPVLLPSAIFRQVLFEATELVPAWALPRAAAGQPPPAPNLPKATKRPRRTKATDTSAAKPTTAKPRSRTRKRDV
jgi:hypothetical protein